MSILPSRDGDLFCTVGYNGLSSEDISRAVEIAGINFTHLEVTRACVNAAFQLLVLLLADQRAFKRFCL